MGNKIKISVIIPVFNGEKFIGQAIQSILNQTFKNFEIIIIDDGSTDSTVKVVRQFDDTRIQLIKFEKNKGTWEARNMGLRIARGEWIAPFDADDAWDRDRLKKMLQVAEQFPNSFIGSDAMICFSGRNNELIPWKTFFEDRQIKSDYLFFPKAADFVKYGLDVKPIIPKKVICENNIYFQEEFQGHEWLYFLLRLFSVGLQYIIINEPLYYYRIRPGSDSTTYSRICSQLKTCSYLQSVDWIDEGTRRLIKKGAKITKYRLFTTALLEKRWKKVMHHAIQSPMSVFYLLRRIPAWLLRRQKSYKISKMYKNNLKI